MGTDNLPVLVPIGLVIFVQICHPSEIVGADADECVHILGSSTGKLLHSEPTHCGRFGRCCCSVVASLVGLALQGLPRVRERDW